jgi:hypothetical protein
MLQDLTPIPVLLTRECADIMTPSRLGVRSQPCYGKIDGDSIPARLFQWHQSGSTRA